MNGNVIDSLTHQWRAHCHTKRPESATCIVCWVPSDRKRPGKTEWAGRRRPSTRQSGYEAKADVRLNAQAVATYELDPSQHLQVDFAIHADPGDRVGFGGWFLASESADVLVLHGPQQQTMSPHSIDR